VNLPGLDTSSIWVIICRKVFNVSRLYSRILVFIAFLSVSVVYSPAQAPVPPSFSLVEGSVVNKVTGGPVNHAHVMYTKLAADKTEPSFPLSTDTDSSGHFALQLQAGTYRIWVERAGFQRQIYGSRTPSGAGSVLFVGAGDHIQNLEMRMVPFGAIAGRVVDEDGEPLQGVGIQVMRYSYASGARQLIPVSGGSSNDRGEYRVYGLPAGKYFLLATLRGTPLSHPVESGALVPEVQQPYAAVYYPGVLDLNSASQIPLPEGGEISDADFHLSRVRAVTVRGRLLSPLEDFANSQLQVVLAHADGNAASSVDRTSIAIDKSTGRFEARGVAPGSYLLVASQLHGKYSLGARLPVEVSGAAPQENLSVPLAPAFDLPGTVQLEGTPISKYPNIRVRLLPVEGLALGAQPASMVGPDGSIRLPGVTPGLWTVVVDSLPEGVWIKSATYGDLDVLHTDLKTGEAATAPLNIVLAGDGGQISGKVAANDQQPVHATVVLVPAATELRGSTQMYRVATTQQQGAFTLKGIPPGSYKLFAFEEVEPYAWLNPDFLQAVETQGVAVSVSEGDRLTQQLAPISPDELLPPR
jgi:carboxypeptidase family protein